ncbi:MAG: hypothetical protein R6V08_06620 [Desulfuromonadales bacterium]
MTAESETKTDQLAKHIPGFRGYRAVHELETDWLLRRFLGGEVEKVRDRLADFIAASQQPDDLGDRLGRNLRTVARLKNEIAPDKEEKQLREPLSEEKEEQLLDLDIALVDRVAALHTPLDGMELAADPEAMEQAMQQFEEGLKEAADLFSQRQEMLAEAKKG